MAMTSNLLCEPKEGEIAHNAVSKTFVSNPGLVDWALFMTQFSMPTAAKMVEATEKWGNTCKKNETAFNVVSTLAKQTFHLVTATTTDVQPFCRQWILNYLCSILSKSHLR
jgi:hypothetical protein